MSSLLPMPPLRLLLLALPIVLALPLWADEGAPERAATATEARSTAVESTPGESPIAPSPVPTTKDLPLPQGIEDIPEAPTQSPVPPAPEVTTDRPGAPAAPGPTAEPTAAPPAALPRNDPVVTPTQVPDIERTDASDDSNAETPDESAAGGRVDAKAEGLTTTPDTIAPSPTPAPVEAFRLLESEIPPGTLRRVAWYPPDSFSGLSEPTPILVAHGAKAGPVLCLTAAIHGDELNGIEMVRRVVYDLDPEELSGTLIGVPIVNLQGFRQGSRYLMDRRDLNRHFPGHRRGSAASRIAHSLFSQIIVHCNALVDLHTGSFHRTNLPQVRGDLRVDSIAHLTKGFGATSVLNGGGPTGSLRRAATDIGIPAVTLEAGEPLRFQPEEVDHGVRALRSLLNHLEMVPRFRRWGEPQPVYYESQWVRANEGGILVSSVSLGEVVRESQLLGTVTDPITNRRIDIRAPFDGRVLGMALNQSVIPGFAAYHIGIRRTESELTESPETVDALGNPLPESEPGTAPVLLPEAINGTMSPEALEDPEDPLDPDRLTDG